MKSKGFTLIELLVIISIIGVLSSVVFVSFSGSRDKARRAKAQNFDAQISHALGAYAVGIWRFEEGTGITLHDESGYGNDGTFHGNPTPVFPVGVYSGTTALQFDGSNDYVNCGNGASLNITDAITIAAWVKPSGAGTYRGIVEKYLWWGKPQFYFTISSGDKLYFRINDNVGSPTAISGDTDFSNEWYHVVAVRGGGNLYLYVNGISDATPVVDATGNIINSENVIIGSRKANDYPFNGSIDDIRIYNETLSSAQIQQQYAAGATSHGIALNE